MEIFNAWETVRRKMIRILKIILQYLQAPTASQLASGNLLFVGFCAAAIPLAGSAITIITGICMVWGMMLILGGKIQWPSHYGYTLIAGCLASFFLAEFLSSALSGFSGDSWSEIAANLIFLGFIPLVALMVAPAASVFRMTALGAASGSLAALAVATIGIGFTAQRLELSTGNASVLAVISGLLFGLALCGFSWLSGRDKWLCLIGAFAAAVLLILTGTRGLWPALLIIPVGLAMLRLTSFKQISIAILVIVAIGIAAGGLAWRFIPMVENRIAVAISDLSEIDTPDPETSLGRRIILWKTAVHLIREKPLFGHGTGDILALSSNYSAQITGEEVGSSHFHNAVLNVMVRSGLFGLIAFLMTVMSPIIVLWRRRNKAAAKYSGSLLISLYVPYFLSGTTGIFFGHDLLDATFVVFVMVAIYISISKKDSSLFG